MASPDTNGGFTRIANELIDTFCRYRLSGEEWLVLWVIIRKTYGFNKKLDAISLGQFSSITGLKRQNVFRAINKLSSKQIIAVIKNGDRVIVSYGLQKDYDGWKPVIKKDDSNQKRLQTVIKKDSELSSKKIPTKDNKDNNKDNTFMSFCNDVMKQWNDFCNDFPVCCKIKSITPERKTKLKKRYTQPDFRNFSSIIDALKVSPFALNQASNSRGWKVSFDFLIENDNNYMKVLEGKYGDGSQSISEGLRKYVKRANDAKKRSYS